MKLSNCIVIILTFHTDLADSFSVHGHAKALKYNHSTISTSRLCDVLSTSPEGAVATMHENNSPEVYDADQGQRSVDVPRSDETTFKGFSEPNPAEYENSRFVCDDSVKFWMDYNKDGTYEEGDYLNDIVGVSERFISKGPEAIGYWLRHNARTGYFCTNAVLGTLSSQLYERLGSNQTPKESFVDSISNGKVISRMMAEVGLSYEQDYKCITEGKYKLPYDMYTPNRQMSPIFFATQTNLFIEEAVATLSRRNRGTKEDKRTWLTDDTSTDIYPDYYKTAFHYQTDGWMSPKSADVYETSTETLFLGRQDAMQRTALIPLVDYAKNRDNDLTPLKVLEVACGTGRFMTFARDNLPADSLFTGVDLSPFYLDKARDNDRNWISIKKQSEQVTFQPATFIQAKAEKLPFQDEEFDAVVCMYLFHELPRDVRAQVSSEMARVTKKGGIVILTDSYQIGDRPVMNKVMRNFEKMNEPYYGDYIEDYLPKHFECQGLECLAKTVRSSTKTLSFKKPE